MDPMLHKAAMLGEIAFLEALTTEEETRYFSNLTPRNNTLLHVAAEFKQAEFFKKVCLKCNPTLIWQQNAKHETPLHVAARVGCLEIVRHLLLEHEGLHNIQAGGIRQENKDGDTALNCAVRSGHKDVVEALLEKDPELCCFSNCVHESPLYLSVSSSFVDIATLILRLSPPSLSYAGPMGQTPLHAAISAIYVSNNKISVLGMMEEVIKKRPELLKEADDIGWTAYHHAAIQGETEGLKLLLKYDTDLSAARCLDHDGNSALHISACWGENTVMELLLKCCPDILELSNKKGRTALHVAVLNTSVRAVEYMLDNPVLGVLLNEPDDDGNTPLHLAVLHDKTQIIEILAKDSRININALNKELKGPADIYLLSYRKLGFTSLKIRSLFQNTNWTRYGRHFFNGVAKDWVNRTPELKPRLSGMKEYKDQRKKSYIQSSEIYLIVATIITTTSFSAAFALPGGYITEGGEKGKPILENKAGFKAFVIFDVLAFCFSLSAVYFQHATAISEQMRGRYQKLQTRFLRIAMIALAFAFASGLYVTLGSSNLGLSSIAYGMLCGLLLLSGLVWCIDPFGARKLLQKRWAFGKYRVQLFQTRKERLLPVWTCLKMNH